MNIRNQDELREQVREAYARAAVASRPGECCCAGEAKARGSVSAHAGYGRSELSALPEGVVVSSFGCGNPVAFTHVRPGETVVDLGSGAGLDLLLAAGKVGPTGRVIGVDMTAEMIARARENIAAAGLNNVEVRQGLIENMPVESSTVDWVISNCVINLSPEKSRVFAEIYRVLKPGGRMLVSDIVVEELPEVLRQSKALYSSCIAGAINEKDYLDGLRQAGMTNVEVMSRLVYDAAQMAGLVKSEMPDVKELLSCCGKMSDDELTRMAEDIGARLQGKIWSATIYAQKPA